MRQAPQRKSWTQALQLALLPNAMVSEKQSENLSEKKNGTSKEVGGKQ